MRFGTKISDEEKKEMLEKGMYQWKEDYFKYSDGNCTSNMIKEDISDIFIDRLSRDSVVAKNPLRELLRKHPTWDEELDGCKINGNHTHSPRKEFVDRYIHGLFALKDLSEGTPVAFCYTEKILNFFYSDESTSEVQKKEAIETIEKFFPKAYAKGKKKSKVLREICNQLGIIDESKGSKFQELFALAADEVNSKLIDYVLFLTVNNSHFLSMSNPKHDSRGATMTSCHSFNSTEYEYNCGCSGYARDEVTLIAFTVKNPKDKESILNRKTSRCLFFYRPGSGVLLQSRMYLTKAGDSYGGVYDVVVPEVKEYRELVQSVIAECEGFPNLWSTKKYADNAWHINIGKACGFGGYPDWKYSNFNAFLSIQKDKVKEIPSGYNPYNIGTYGLCISCGEETTQYLYCDDCDDREEQYDCHCDCCDEDVSDVYEAYMGNNVIYVCESCKEDYFHYCDDCSDLTHEDDGNYYEGNGAWICNDCRDRYYKECNCCNDTLIGNGNENIVLDKWFDEICLCDSCFDDETVTCENCERVFMYDAIGDDGLCDECRDELDEEDEENEDEE